MRINKWPPKRKYLDLLLNSLNWFLKEMYGDQFGEFVCWYWDLKSQGPLHVSPVDRAQWPPSPDPTLGLALLPLDEFRLWVHMRNFSPVSEMKKGQRSWWRVLAPNSRNKGETWRITKIITFAPIIASATLKTVSLQLNGMLMMAKYSRQFKTIPSRPPEFIPLSSW